MQSVSHVSQEISRVVSSRPTLTNSNKLSLSKTVGGQYWVDCIDQKRFELLWKKLDFIFVPRQHLDSEYKLVINEILFLYKINHIIRISEYDV